MREAQLTITTAIESGVTRVALHGELDLHGAPKVTDELHAIAEGNPQRVVLDVSGLEFLDSVGLRAILDSRQVLEAAGVPLTLEGVTGTVERVLEATGLLDLLTEP